MGPPSAVQRSPHMTGDNEGPESQPPEGDAGKLGEFYNTYLNKENWVATIGLFLGPIIFLAIMIMPTPQGMTESAKIVAAVTGLTATWWITEAVPIPVASLVPLVMIPLFGAMDMRTTASEYASPIIFLFLGGFILAQGMTKWGLHKRIALHIIKLVGTKPQYIIMGFMVASAFLSMWISNTATAVMMMPMGIAVADLSARNSKGEDENIMRFIICLMLAIAFGCTIGGIGTLIGTPPNALFAEQLGNYEGAPEISFLKWMQIGIPMVLVFLPIAWLLLVKVVYPLKMKELPGGIEFIESELKKLGKMGDGEKIVGAVFSIVALMWLTRPIISDHLIPGINDSVIAVAGAIVLFVIPVNLSKREFALDWDHAVKIPWGVLLLFGGGLAIAKAFLDTGLAEFVGDKLIWLDFLPLPLLILSIGLFTAFMSEVTSNTATVALLLPIMTAMSIALSIHPMLLMLTVTISGSLVFMLPVGTPPNAIVFASGKLTIPMMSKAGLPIKIVLLLIFTVLMYLLVIPIMGIDPSNVPSWANNVINLGA